MTDDIPTPPPEPDAVSPPPAEAPPAPPPTEEAALAATGEGVPAAEAPAETAADQPPAEPEAKEAEEPEKPAEAPSNKHWYVVKVQSGREESIKEAIERRVKIEGLEEFFGQIVIPVEKVVEMRNSKRVTRERKLYPGYLMTEVEYNDRILYLFRETSGVGDFVGAGVNRAPVPMTPREVERMIRKAPGKEGEPAKELPTKAPVDRGDRVKVKDGTFAGMEGEVKEVIEAKSQVRVELVIFGRPVPVDLEYWQVEPA
jgi:transcriptional antiterminator NusG